MSRRPNLFSIPPHRPFADALAEGMRERWQGATALARGILLVPNSRAARTFSEAFVRISDGGLLLPRLIPIGDAELGERLGGALEPVETPFPLAIEPIERLMLLTRLLQRSGAGDAAEALRLAQELARTLDQLLVEQVEPSRLKEFAAGPPELSQHWQASLQRLALLFEAWPGILEERGCIDLVERRNRLLAAVAERWRREPPAGFVVAAGITTSAPAIAQLLRAVASLDNGMVVLPALDLDMDEEEWAHLGSGRAEPGREPERALETHPQFHLKLVLERMGMTRSDVALWPEGKAAAPAESVGRSRAVAHAMAAPHFTQRWLDLTPSERSFPGVQGLEAADPAEEAQAIAIALREAVEARGRTAALVTPDRSLARRVAAHLGRWGIEADDSAGRPLSETPPGTLLLALATAASERFAPVALLALLKHPLVRKGEARLPWLDRVRALDLVLRGPRPPAGLDGMDAHLASQPQLLDWWAGVAALLRPLERALAAGTADLAPLAEALGSAAAALSGDAIWEGPAGRSAADLHETLLAAARSSPVEVEASSLAPVLERILAGVAVRPLFGQHPRIFIWGLLEARLQHADLMILGGLNEGSWPGVAAPDPWLAPAVRRRLGLPSLERNIGLSAHDFAMALAAPAVLVTRARREARAPAIASRFWLRLRALTGGLPEATALLGHARALDLPAETRPADQPAPAPEPALRPKHISVTDVDRLKADPFAFYAAKMLALRSLDPIDAEPSPAWRGTAVHKVLEQWMQEDDCAPGKLRLRAEALLAGAGSHPLMRALWQPRLMEAIEFIAQEVRANREAGRRPLAAEVEGMVELDGVHLKGKADRIDRDSDGRLVIVDYKTGSPPSAKSIANGFSMQLGLLGVIAERGGFEGIGGSVGGFEYWSLAKAKGQFGRVCPIAGMRGIDADSFVAEAERQFLDAVAKWLLGTAPFTAKLHPEYSPYGEYDQLMRLEEWYGRD